jgi:transmembrane sensor
MTDKHFHNWEKLVSQYFANTITKAELEVLLEKTRSGEDLEALTAELRKHWEMSNEGAVSKPDEAWDELFADMMQKAASEEDSRPMKKKQGFRRFFRIAAAAALVLSIGVTAYFYYLRPGNKETKSVQPVAGKATQDLLPGKAGAILTLADGKSIALDSAGNQVLAVQGNTTIRFNDGQVIYDGEKGRPSEMLYNTIETPRGRQFQLLLADGSKVWLNAASTIRFPASFNGSERKVDITGEAYFEVAEQYSGALKGNVPFIVHVHTPEGDGGDIKVLGTQFNINTYDQKAMAKTTLLKGSVRITRDNFSQTLSPGQQALVRTGKADNATIRIVENVDVDQVMAWKNGYFSFANTSLDGVMQQISRWYDVDIVYEGKIPERKFGGEISRNNNASQVLKVLEESDVHFRIDGRKIIVMP